MDELTRVFNVVWIMLGGAFLMTVFDHHGPGRDGWESLLLTGAAIQIVLAVYQRIIGLWERQNALLQQIASALNRQA